MDELQITDGKGGTRIVRLPAERAVIGRSVRCEVRLDSNTISRQHAELMKDPFGRWWVRDLGSRNGTAVNGVTVGEHVVEPGDYITIEDYQMKLLGSRQDASIPVEQTVSLGSMTVRDPGQGRIRRLEEFEAPKISAQHLSALTEFGNRLLEIRQPQDRLRALCDLMVSDRFKGRSAVPLRLPLDPASKAEPEGLCEPAKLEGETPYLSTTLLRAVRENQSPVMASNVGGNTGVVELSLAGSVMELAAMACPIRSDSNMMDVLYATFPGQYGTGEWLAMAELAAKQFQQAEAAWKARAKAQAQAAIERELERARQIQYRFVPQPTSLEGLEVSFGFEPCLWVAGDFVDFMKLPDGRVIVTIADVCGKGLQAALITVSIHTVIHASTAEDVKLHELINRLNRYLYKTLPDGSFVTLASMIVDPKTGELECINAGHPPAFVFNANGEMRKLSWGNNLPLGLLDEPLDLCNARIEPGEVVLMYTDGLSEMTNHDGEMIGVDGLGALVEKLYHESPDDPLDRIAGRISGAMRQLQGNRLASDDQTFLAFRCGSPASTHDSVDVSSSQPGLEDDPTKPVKN